MITMRQIIAFVIPSILLIIMSTNISYGLNVWHTTDLVRYNANNQDYFRPAGSSKISLHAAGNETVAFQIVLSDIPKTLEQITINTDHLKGEKIFEKRNIELFLLQNCQETYQPDCIVPIESGEPLSCDALTKDDKKIWFDLYVPSEQLAGIYRGDIEIDLGKKNLVNIEVELTVYPFQLPGKPSLETDLNNYGVGFVKVWKREIGSDKGYEIERAFHRLARKHRMTFNPLPYKSQRGSPHPTMAPKIVGKGDNIHISDWSAYDKRYAPYFSGTAFEDGIAIDHQYLPFNPEWPSDFSNYLTDRETYEKEWIIIGKEFVRHFEEKGWNNSVFQIYLNQKPRSNNRIPWNLDEPKGVKDYQALRYYADLTHKVFSEEGKAKVKFRIDISHFYCDKHRRNPLKDFRVNGGGEILSPVDVWVISKHSMDNLRPQKEALKLKTLGKTLYEYLIAPLIDSPLLMGVQYGWTAWLRDEDGIMFWNTVKKKGKVSNGNDFLVYTGTTYGINGPIASVRLKTIRRGIQDYEYIKLASKYKKEEVSRIVKNCDLSNLNSYKKSLNKLANIIISSRN